MQLLLEYAHILVLETALLYMHKFSPYGLPQPENETRPQKYLDRGYEPILSLEYK